MSRFIVIFLAIFSSLLRCGSRRIGENDLSLHLYTPDGQVAQMAYATRAVEASAPRLSFQDKDTGVIASFAVSELPSGLCGSLKPTIEVELDGSVVYVPTGYFADVSYLLKNINNIVQSHCLIYGESPNLDYLAYHISNWVTRGMYKQDKEDRLSRPLAVATTLASFDKVAKRNRLLQVDNTGFVCDKQISILGKLSTADRALIEATIRNSEGKTGGSQIIDNWINTCNACLSVLINNRNDADSSTVCNVECCLLDAKGGIYRSPEPMRQVSDVVAWIKRTVKSDSFKH